MIITILLLTFTLSSCKKKNQKEINENPTYNRQELEQALSYNNQTNLTCRISMKELIKSGGVSQEISILMTMRLDNNYASLRTTIAGSTIEQFEIISGYTVDVYTKQDGKWTGPETVSLIESGLTNSTSTFIKLTPDMFKFEKGIWVGNTTALNNSLNDTLLNQFGESFKELGVYGITIKVTKYNLKITNNVITNLNMEMELNGQIQGESFYCKLSMSSSFSNYGLTNVSIPSGLDK